MSSRLERELKLDAPPEFSLARLPERLDGCRAAPAQLRRLHTRYYDTADLRLSRWGCSLRYRVGEGWTLKLAVPGAPGPLVRAEHVFAGDPGNVPSGALDLATPYLRGAEVAPVAELRTLRTKRAVCSTSGQTLAEIVEDDVHVVDGPRTRKRFRQVEIELAEAAEDALLDVLAAALRERGAGAANPIPKDVLALRRDPDERELSAPKLRRRACLRDVAKAALARSVERIIRNDAAIRLTHDADAVHKARTSVRRLRSHLRTFEDVFAPGYARPLAERLRWLGDTFGEARDADVLLARVEADAERLPHEDALWTTRASAPFRAARETAYEHLVETMRAPQYAALLDDLVAAAERFPRGPWAEAVARDAAPRMLYRTWRKVRKRVRKTSRPPTDAELHGIRIKAKYVRYAAEALAPVIGKRAARLAKAAEKLQKVLGEQHDATTAASRLSEPRADGRATFVAGELAAHEREAADAARESWRPVWKQLTRRRAAIG